MKQEGDGDRFAVAEDGGRDWGRGDAERDSLMEVWLSAELQNRFIGQLWYTTAQ